MRRRKGKNSGYLQFTRTHVWNISGDMYNFSAKEIFEKYYNNLVLLKIFKAHELIRNFIRYNLVWNFGDWFQRDQKIPISNALICFFSYFTEKSFDNILYWSDSAESLDIYGWLDLNKILILKKYSIFEQ